MGRSEVWDIRVRLKCDPDTTIRSGSRLKFEKLTGVGGGQILGRLIGEMTHLSKNTLRSVPQMFETLGFEISGKIYSDSEMRVNLNTWFACGVFHVTEDVKFRRNFCFCYSLFLRIENNL